MILYMDIHVQAVYTCTLLHMHKDMMSVFFLENFFGGGGQTNILRNRGGIGYS